MKPTHLLLLLLALAGCTTEQSQKIAAFKASPEGNAILDGVRRTVLAAATSAVKQAATTGHIDQAEVAKDSLSGVGQQIRTLQSTDSAAQPSALAQAVKEGSVVASVTRKVSPAIIAAVADAVKKGAPADLANEAAAVGLDQAAKSPSH